MVLVVAACGALSGCTAGGAAGRSNAEPRSEYRLALGTLVGRDGSVTILATPQGTRYDLRSPDGALVGAGLTAAEVRARTGQDPRNALAAGAPDSDEDGVPLMMLDQRFGDRGRD